MSSLGAALVLAALATAEPAPSACGAAREVALEAVSTQVGAPDRFEVLSLRCDGARELPPGVSLRVVSVEGPNASGFAVVRLRGSASDGTSIPVRATARGVVSGPAVVALRPLKRGQAIDDSHLAVRTVDLTRLREPPVRSVATAAGRAPVRTLGAGRVLAPSLLRAAPVVRRGEEIDVRIESARLSVRARAVALIDGAPGDRIPADNPATGARLVGTVQDDGSLLVGRHAVPRR